MSTTDPGAGLTLESATKLRFPPFPPVPDGVNIIPFASFRPSGILVPIDDDDDDDEGGDQRTRAGEQVERDGMGIPTVVLRAKHASDGLEKKKRKKKKAGGAQQVQVAPEKPKTWWEVWEELEDIRRNAYDPNMTPADRLYQASIDFKNGRTWPATTPGVQHVWDIFRIYIGVLQQTPAPAKNAILDADVESDDTDSEMDDLDGAVTSGKDEDSRMENFLRDPELSMKIFFSSHFRERGLVWSEPRCIATPILVSFFFRYLIRSRVFPEPEYERPIRRALEIVELARVELPNSWKMGRVLPDAFSDGCKDLWGSMQAMWVHPEVPSLDRGDEPGTKRQRMAESEDAEPQRQEQPSAGVDVDSVMTAAESRSAFAGGEWGTAAGEDDLMEGWGANAHSWADDDMASVEGEGEPVHRLAPPIWDASLVDIQATWNIEPRTLLPLLGPSALPLTHTTGVVEQSTRRIVRIEPPRAPRQLAHNAPAAEAVEEDLACRFARLVLAPWERLDKGVYKGGSDVLPPSMPTTNRGAVVMEEDEDEKEVKAVKGAHRPWKDEISVLVERSVTESLMAGMGIGATWVEIARESEGSSRGKKEWSRKYWYMEQLVHQLPSFYTDM
ncbi:hypothetical protein F5148DRAFT_983458 [Russula earlei]|uniref:Uncharacterized protein n=1 Tax=Russula earlei TaxID=71964 RepID=A0ACC0U499_9AGAM|nr:hypothetical protein F5148DRAFT_983458 [Russula earlei]